MKNFKKALLMILISILLIMNCKNIYAVNNAIDMENSAVNLISKLLNNNNLSLNAYTFLDLSGVEDYESLRSYIITKSKEDKGFMKTFKHTSEAEFDGTFKQKGISDSLATIKKCLQEEETVESFKKTINSKMSGGNEESYNTFYKVYTIILKYNEGVNGSINVGDKNDPEKNGWETLENGKKKYKINGEYAIGWTRIQNEYYYFGENGEMFSQEYSPSGFYLKKNGQWDRNKVKEENIKGTDVTSSTNTQAPEHYNDIQDEIEENVEEEKKTISGSIIMGSSNSNLGNNEKVDPDNYTPGSTEAPTTLVKVAQIIISVLKTIGVIVAVIALIFIGYKYVTGSVSEKAEYKKTLIPYIVGIIVLANLGWIIQLIASFITGIKL